MWFINNALRQKTCSVTPWLVKTLGTNLLYDIIGSIKTGKISCVCGLAWQKALHSFPPSHWNTGKWGCKEQSWEAFKMPRLPLPPLLKLVPSWSLLSMLPKEEVLVTHFTSLPTWLNTFWWASYKMAICVLSLTHRTVWLALTVLFCLL